MTRATLSPDPPEGQGRKSGCARPSTAPRCRLVTLDSAPSVPRARPRADQDIGRRGPTYIAWHTDGVLVLDITDPYNPVEVGRYLRDLRT